MTNSSKKILNNDSTILIATFSLWSSGRRLPTNGSVEPLRDFFVPKVKKLVLIDQTVPGSDFVMPQIEVYRQKADMKILSSSKWLSVLVPFLKLRNKHGTSTSITFKLRDFLSVFDWCLRDRRTKYDFFIGLECINAFAGILLRRMGFVKRVIYYVSDYSPQRYPQKWFNWLYIQLDRFCAMHSDYIWDVSKAMQPARIQAGLNPNKSAPVIHVPNALYPTQIKYNPVNKIRPFSLIYMGTLGKENGSDIAITVMPDIIIKYPQATLHIIGGGEKDMPRLKKLVSELKLEKIVKFYDYIPDANKMSKIIRNCYVALAPYRAFSGSPRYYGDAGKIRAYAAAGIPIITTDVPPLGREVVKVGAAIIIKDNPVDLTAAVDKVFSDRKLYLKLRKNSIRFAKNNIWENTFGQAFINMHKQSLYG